MDNLLQLREIRRVCQTGTDGLACLLAQIVATQAAHAHICTQQWCHKASAHTQPLTREKTWLEFQPAAFKRTGDASKTQRLMTDKPAAETQR